MTADPDDEGELQGALSALPRETLPPKALEERTVQVLRRAGLLRAPRRHFWAMGAAALVLVGLAYTAGAARSGLMGDRGPRYVLLLREDAAFHVPPGGEEALVAEYRDWALRLRRERRLLSGEELDPAALLLPRVASPPEEARVTGFFVILAGDDSEALAIAKTCPHVLYGGKIEVRRIHPT